MDLSAAIGAWRILLGDARVLQGDALQHYTPDTGAARRRILGALRIDDAGTLPQVMQIATAHRVRVHPISTGNNWGYGSALPPRDDCMLLDLSPLQAIVDFDDELGVVTLEPGVTQQMLAHFLHEGGHPFMVPVTGAGPNCSLVGNALERGYGITLHPDHFGAVTDVQAVLCDGSLYRTALHEAGGADLARLFKWGIGPYSAGLFTQSGFGVVTRLSIVLARKPECIQACLFSLQSDALLEPAVLALRDLLGQLPGTLGGANLMNRHRVLAMSAPLQDVVLGTDGRIPAELIAQLGRRHQVAQWTGFASLYGTRGIVRAAQHEIRKRLKGVASRLLFVTPARAHTLNTIAAWVPGKLGQRLVRMTGTLSSALELVVGQPNETALALAYLRNRHTAPAPPRHPAHDGCGLLWYAPLVPMRAPQVRAYVELVDRVTQRHGMEPLITLTSLNDRMFDSTVPLLFDQSQPAAARTAQNCLRALLHEGRAEGVFPYRVGIDSMDYLASLQADSKTLHDRLRRSLDPHDLLSPGRYSS